MKKSNGIQIPYIGVMKYLLILGIILIHSNLYFAADQYNLGVKIVNFIASIMCNVCVPCFFFLSGMLFFNGIRDFTFSIYLRKIKSRVKSLFIPYILWCLFCALLLLIKSRYLNFPGFDIFLSNGQIDFQNFLIGFWAIKETGRPYAFAFWFIRNLMVFCILSPAAYSIARSKVLTIIFILLCILINKTLAGFQWFVLGAFYVMHSHKQYPAISARNLFIASAIFWSICIAEEFVDIRPILDLVALLKISASLYLTFYFAKFLTERVSSKTINHLIAPTFMIYATHQCYCTVIHTAWGRLFGYESVIGPILAYFMSFITLVAAGYLFYIILHHFCPRVLNLITGGRE